MVLVHMTGDMKWLAPPYMPKRDIRLIPDPQAGVPTEIQDEIRAAVLKLFANGEPEPAIADPGDELMLRMMRACLGENVAPEYAPLMREEMRFVPRDARWKTQPPAERLQQDHVLIVGAGVCAIALGVGLGRVGDPYTIVERTTNWAAHGTSIDTPAAASIRRTTPTRSPSARETNGAVISLNARNCWITSRRSRSSTTFAATSASTRN
jgi:hypothetical protein